MIVLGESLHVKESMRTRPSFLTPNHCLRLVWDRLTLSRLTTGYFLFSLANCLVQISLQAEAFSINNSALAFVWDLAQQAQGFRREVVPVLHDSFLDLCPSSYIEDHAAHEAECIVVWNATTPSSDSTLTPTSASTTLATASSTSVDVSGTSDSATATPTSASSGTEEEEFDNEDTESEVNDVESEDEEEGIDLPVFSKRDTDNIASTVSELPEECLLSMQFPVSILRNTKHEDIVFIAFQIWVLGMSVVAILNHSLPHLIASCATHLLSTLWSGFQIVHTKHFNTKYHRVVVNGACAGVGTSFLPNYWNTRARLEYATLALNIVALLVSIFLSWKLVKLYGWQTFKRLGASLKIHRIYEMILAFSIVLQLSLFFMIATVALWIESLFNGIAADVAYFRTFYLVTGFIALIAFVPWLVTGWIAVRKEKRTLTFAFLALSLLYLIGWATMFYSDTFRWTFLNWVFFSIMASISVALTVTTFILGIICRYNFGKGLPEFLNNENEVTSTSFSRDSMFDDEEKVIPFPMTHRENRFQFDRMANTVFGQEAPPPVLPSMYSPSTISLPSPPPPTQPAFLGHGRAASSSGDLPLARPGFRELLLRSDTTTSSMTYSTTHS